MAAVLVAGVHNSAVMVGQRWMERHPIRSLSPNGRDTLFPFFLTMFRFLETPHPLPRKAQVHSIAFGAILPDINVAIPE